MGHANDSPNNGLNRACQSVMIKPQQAWFLLTVDCDRNRNLNLFYEAMDGESHSQTGEQ
jgi:hypothetical protein